MTKKYVVYTVRVTIIVSLYTRCLPIIHIFKCCPSYCYILGERKKINHAAVYLKKVIGYIALPFFSAVKYFEILGIVLGLVLIIGIPTCIGITVCYRKRKRTYRRFQNQDHVVIATPATGASVDTSNQTAIMANPVFHAQPQYSQQSQQPVDQLSSEDTSPYSTVSAIPSLITQQPSQVIFFYCTYSDINTVKCHRASGYLFICGVCMHLQPLMFDSEL